jgi:hypothetical protein
LAIDRFGGSGIILNNPTGGSGDIVKECFIGTDLTGQTRGIGNVLDGVLVLGHDNTIGGIGISEGNLISGNSSDGVEINGASAVRNAVYQNTIGVDISTIQALANSGDGVNITNGASSNTVGGVVFPFGNAISGNSRNGVELNTSNNNYVLGNYIGLATDGSTFIANGGDGVAIHGGASNNVVGQILGSNGNFIAGNQNGVSISDNNTSNNQVMGNLIGLSGDGTQQRANQLSGVLITSGAFRNTVGGTGTGQGNVISGNLASGVLMNSSATQNLVVQNYIGTN